MTLITLISSIVISCGSLAWGFVEAGLNVSARWVLIFGVVWLLTQWQGWGWFSSVGLIFIILASVFGVWFGLIPEWMFSSSIFALVAWDMSEFRRSLRVIAANENRYGMERRHIARITFLSLIGLFLASITMLVRENFTDEWGALLVIVILFGLWQLGGWFRK